MEDPTSGNRILHHATQAEEPSVSCQKISAATSPCLTLQIAIPLITMCGALLSKGQKKTPLYNTKDKLKAKVMAVFTNLNKETVGKARKRLQSHLEAVVEANDDFFE